jgi:beta-galactosidase/beta-glucuronidase
MPALKEPPLATEWTAQVDRNNPLPEYPRPQLVREEWLSLNGVWQFAPGRLGDSPPFSQTLRDAVIVPFPLESALSGYMKREVRMWYRRAFEVPAGWQDKRVLLHFGAVDWNTDVYVNGNLIGNHKGGYDAFSFDITDQLREGANELIVGVIDPTDVGGQPIGKQRLSPGGIWYSSMSGIWQTVWLEPVSDAHIEALHIVPDVEGKAVMLTVQSQNAGGYRVQAEVLEGSTSVVSAAGDVSATLRIPIAQPKLWSPDSPFLYDLRVLLLKDGEVIDEVMSYFGMRSVGLKEIDGVLRPVLNGHFIFQMGVLDQGFWPDGIYTAPTDDALMSDIQRLKDLGYNTIRKHVKVEPQRWYYWADRLGMLVWQDMPSMRHDRPPAAEDKMQFEAELREMINEHRNSPAIVQWVIFNEGWGQYGREDTARITNEVKALDPSRLVNSVSGWNVQNEIDSTVDAGVGDISDVHYYVGPGVPPQEDDRASILGEYGGLGLKVSGHEWNPYESFNYEMQNSPAELTRRYLSLLERVQGHMMDDGLSSAIYTQVTDVETEVNGLFTYDRAITKPDAAQLKVAHDQLIAASKALNR